MFNSLPHISRLSDALFTKFPLKNFIGFSAGSVPDLQDKMIDPNLDETELRAFFVAITALFFTMPLFLRGREKEGKGK